MNILSDAFADTLLTSGAGWPTLTARVALVTSDYIFNPAAPVYPAVGQIFALSEPLEGLAVQAGWAKANSALFQTPLDDALVAAAALLVVYPAVGDPEVVAFMPSVTGLPFSGHTPFWLGWQPSGIFRP